ncbi:MAG: hypothetical protein NXI31_20920 [bacterium]|nr:hypothetical protein [bacterium]
MVSWGLKSWEPALVLRPDVPESWADPNAPYATVRRPMLCVILSCLTAALPVPHGSAHGRPTAERAHPADGPDIDVRVLIGKEGVVCTLLLNLAFVDQVIDAVREDDEAIHPIEYESHRLDLIDHFAATNQLRINGQVVTPKFRSFEVGEPDLSLLPLFPRSGAKALTKLRLVLEYPALAAPAQVGLVWGEFPPDLVLETEAGIPQMAINVQLTARGLRKVLHLTEDEPEYVWHDTGESLADLFAAVPKPAEIEKLELSVVSLALFVVGGVAVFTGVFRRPARRRAFAAAVLAFAGGAMATSLVRVEIDHPFGGGVRLPTEAEAMAVFEPLHANIYRAFDYVDESEIYDALAGSVEGPLLDRIYNRIFRGLILQEEGGAVCRIDEVRPLETRVESVGVLEDDVVGFMVWLRWQVAGSVSHWGHSHSRTNQYEARYTVAQSPAGWRIRDNEVLAQEVISTSTTDPRGMLPTESGNAESGNSESGISESGTSESGR